MPTGDISHRPSHPLRKLRSRWFAPSRPLAVDDEPQWRPAADAVGDAPRSDAERSDAELERPSTPTSAP
jgi:hypothetical protein